MSRVRPRMMDPMAFGMVSVAFGIGVLFVAHHAKTMRLDVEGANLAWVVLVAFGMTWHGEWRAGLRVGAGLVVGALASIAAYYGAMSVLPATPFSLGLGLGVGATCVALLSHMYPRALSFAAVAVGYGVGIAAARSLPMRPTTPADDLFALMLTASFVLVIGVSGSLFLRAAVVRMGMERAPSSFFARFVPHRGHHELQRDSAASSRQKTGAGR